jgi:hypothetical protein
VLELLGFHALDVFLGLVPRIQARSNAFDVDGSAGGVR